jgi:uncharacterized protein with HEPN domain
MTDGQSPRKGGLDLRLADYLRHITEAIIRIESYVEDCDELGFLNSTLIQDAVLRNIEIIGEASHSVEMRFAEFANTHADVPWSVAYSTRNVIAHGYFKVDLELVWKMIQIDLPPMYAQVTRLLEL